MTIKLREGFLNLPQASAECIKIEILDFNNFSQRKVKTFLDIGQNSERIEPGRNNSFSVEFASYKKLRMA